MNHFEKKKYCETKNEYMYFASNVFKGLSLNNKNTVLKAELF